MPWPASPNVDGVVALTHKSGCGASPDGDAVDLLRRTLGGYARHPNFAAVILVGLGCEDNQVKRLLEHEALAPASGCTPIQSRKSGGRTPPCVPASSAFANCCRM